MGDEAIRQQIMERTARMRHDDHVLSVFNFDHLLQDILKFNDKLKEQYGTDMIALTQLGQSGGQISKQIRLLGVLGLAYVKTALDGKEYLIFKGYAGKRPNLSGTRYALENPKVSCFVVGGRELLKDGLKATRIAIVANVAIDVIKEIQADHFCLSRLMAHVASDIIQAVVATAAGVATGVVVGGVFALAGVTAPVVLVFAAAVGFGFFTSMTLNNIDARYKMTERLVSASMAFESQMKKKASGLRSAFRREVAEVDRAISDTSQMVIDVYGVAVRAYEVWQSVHDMMRQDWHLPLTRSAY